MWGPAAPHAGPKLRELEVRRYRCIRCRALMTVVPSETLTKRLYSAVAIGWALALYGLSMLSPTAVRLQVSPWGHWGAASAAGWQTLRRWVEAAMGGRLFDCVRPMPAWWAVRKVAATAASTLAGYALPVPEPPALDVLAFQGAAQAR